jgi:hypothetical protein
VSLPHCDLDGSVKELSINEVGEISPCRSVQNLNLDFAKVIKSLMSKYNDCFSKQERGIFVKKSRASCTVRPMII